MTMPITDIICVAAADEGQLVLSKTPEGRYAWKFLDRPSDVILKANTVQEAIRLGEKWGRDSGFKMQACGYLFTLPEREEHGNNALFSQMVKSLESPNGVYFDEGLGHLCVVHQIPIQARRLYERIRDQLAK